MFFMLVLSEAMVFMMIWKLAWAWFFSSINCSATLVLSVTSPSTSVTTSTGAGVGTAAGAAFSAFFGAAFSTFLGAAFLASTGAAGVVVFVVTYHFQSIPM